jgi:tyrosyl-tRNA synthetase
MSRNASRRGTTVEQALSTTEAFRRLQRGAAEIVEEEELNAKLVRAEATGRPLVVKLGADPSAPDLHLGHAVVLRKLRQFQDLGHVVVFLIGDFTGRVGDPTGRNESRRQLSEEEVQANARTYEEQVFRILDRERTLIRFNSAWLGRLDAAELVRLMATTTVARMLEREDFRQRFRDERPIHLHEFLYPLLQGYDSVALKADVELGGTDQRFNILMARQVMREYGLEPEVGLFLPILPGLDGVQKMSKSLGNYIGLTEGPDEMFGKIMSIPDDLMPTYFRLLTDVPEAEVERLLDDMARRLVNPRDVKVRLGTAIVAEYHGEEAARRAAEEFLRVFSARALPSDLPEVPCPPEPVRLARFLADVGLAASAQEAKRLLEQGAVEIDGVRYRDPSAVVRLTPGAVVRVGRRRFLRLKG